MTHKLIELTSQVSPHASVRKIRMTSGQFFAPETVPETSSVQFAISAKHKPAEDMKQPVCNVNFMLRTVEKDGDHTETGLRIVAEYEVSFSVKGEHEPEAIDAFARVNSVFIAWPYLREFAQTSTCRMGLPPLTLPLITAPAIARHLSEDVSIDSEVPQDADADSSEG